MTEELGYPFEVGRNCKETGKLDDLLLKYTLTLSTNTPFGYSLEETKKVCDTGFVGELVSINRSVSVSVMILSSFTSLRSVIGLRVLMLIFS